MQISSNFLNQWAWVIETDWKLHSFNFAKMINLTAESDEYQLAVLRYSMEDDKNLAYSVT